MARLSQIDQFVKEFCSDALESLKKYDRRIRKNLLSETTRDFYEFDFKGLGVHSITEPKLQFLIYMELSNKYRIWPEGSFYIGSQLIDFALFYDEKFNLDNPKPEIGIELKWAGLLSKDNPGSLNKWSKEALLNDSKKLLQYTDIPNKYVMQFIITNQLIDEANIASQINECKDNTIFKQVNFKVLYLDHFITLGTSKEYKSNFYLLLWKLIPC